MLGEPWDLATDLGPVIDRKDQERFEAHVRRLERKASLVYLFPLPQEARFGTYVAP